MKHLFFVLLLLVSSNMFGQSKAQQERIKQIRALVEASNKRYAENSKEHEYTDNSIHLEMNRMQPGAGMQHYTIDMGIEDQGNEEEFEQDWHPYFFRVKYNYAAREIVCECHIGENGKPLFIFRRLPDEDALYEDRLYFNPDGSLCYASETRYENPDGKKVVRQMKKEDESVVYDIKFYNQIINWVEETKNL